MKNRISKKPRLLVLSTDSTTHQLIPRKMRVARACLICRRRKRRCDGGVPCSFCKKAGRKCEFDKSYIAPRAHAGSTGTFESSTSASPSPSQLSRSLSSSSLSSPPSLQVIGVTTTPTMNVTATTTTTTARTTTTTTTATAASVAGFEPSTKIEGATSVSDGSEYRREPNDFDYKRIVETIFPENVLDSIRRRFQNETDPTLSNEYLLSLLRQNVNSEQNMMNLNNLLSNAIERPHLQQFHPTSLPPRDVALRLILKTWNNACTLMRFYHRPTVVNVLDSMYTQNSQSALTPAQKSIQPLIFAVLAVGALFSKDDFHQDDYVNRQFYNSESLRYFNRAKELIDLREIPDTPSLQALFMMSIFRQCCADLKGCYYYIGIAERAALAMGLHKRSSLVGPSQIQDECRKRLFWSIHKVDIYMNCILGLPCSLSEDMVDQELPLDIDDDRITAESHWSAADIDKSGQHISSCGVNNEHTKLILIMSRIYRKFYTLNLPILRIKERDITHFEKELGKWLEGIPPMLKRHISAKDVPNTKADPYIRPGKLLLFDFLLTKLVLYKPFFHFITIDFIKRKSECLRFQVRMAHNCIDISKDIIDVSSKVVDEGLLNGSYWCFIHTIFYSVAILTVYKFLLERRVQKNDNNNNSSSGVAGGEETSNEAKELEIINKYSEIGYKVLIYLKKTSIASSKIFYILSSMVNEFNQKTIELSHQIMESPIMEDERREKNSRVGAEQHRVPVGSVAPTKVQMEPVPTGERPNFSPKLDKLNTFEIGPSAAMATLPSRDTSTTLCNEPSQVFSHPDTQNSTNDGNAGNVTEHGNATTSVPSPFTDTDTRGGADIEPAGFYGEDSLNELLFDPGDFLEKLSGYLEI